MGCYTGPTSSFGLRLSIDPSGQLIDPGQKLSENRRCIHLVISDHKSTVGRSPVKGRLVRIDDRLAGSRIWRLNEKPRRMQPLFKPSGSLICDAPALATSGLRQISPVAHAPHSI
jgi:hypothetical protein